MTRVYILNIFQKYYSFLVPIFFFNEERMTECTISRFVTAKAPLVAISTVTVDV